MCAPDRACANDGDIDIIAHAFLPMDRQLYIWLIAIMKPYFMIERYSTLCKVAVERSMMEETSACRKHYPRQLRPMTSSCLAPAPAAWRPPSLQPAKALASCWWSAPNILAAPRHIP